MKLLLDTHALLWTLYDNPRLGLRTRRALNSDESQVWISAATAWEIATKCSLGRLALQDVPERVLPAAMRKSGFQELAVTIEHALAVLALPRHHSDPLDRLLIAQAQIEGLTIVTADAAFESYNVAIIDASS